MPAFNANKITVTDSFSQRLLLVAVVSLTHYLAISHLVITGHLRRFYLLFVLDARIVKQILYGRPEFLSDVTLIAQPVRAARGVQMHVAGRYALADHHILCKVVVGRVWRYEAVTGRVVIKANPSDSTKERVKYGLMDVTL